ncbi:MAG: hypothetical protein AAGI30_13080 [Planctomycetota bacterium]
MPRSFRPALAVSAAAMLAGAHGLSAEYIRDYKTAIQNAEALTTRITIQADDITLEDLFAAIEQTTGARLEPLWQEDRAPGLERDARVSVDAENRAAFTIIERVLENTQLSFDENNWQFTPEGELEMGPESRLVRRAYLTVYDVADLIYDAPDFTDAPEVDVETQGGGGGGAGGGGNIFGGGGGGGGEEDEFEEEEDQLERLEDLVDLIQGSVEPEHWLEAGGRATIRIWNRQLLIRAAPFIQRKISGSDVLNHHRLSSRAYHWANSYERERSMRVALIERPEAPSGQPPDEAKAQAAETGETAETTETGEATPTE